MEVSSYIPPAFASTCKEQYLNNSYFITLNGQNKNVFTFKIYLSVIIPQNLRLENIKLLGIIICSVHVFEACASMPCKRKTASSDELDFDLSVGCLALKVKS